MFLIIDAVIALLLFLFFKKTGLFTLLIVSCIAVNARILGGLYGYIESAQHFGKPIFEGSRMMAFGMAFVINAVVAWAVILLCWFIYKRKKTQ